jgi:hypothetical protein
VTRPKRHCSGPCLAGLPHGEDLLGTVTIVLDFELDGPGFGKGGTGVLKVENRKPPLVIATHPGGGVACVGDIVLGSRTNRISARALHLMARSEQPLGDH